MNHNKILQKRIENMSSVVKNINGIYTVKNDTKSDTENDTNNKSGKDSNKASAKDVKVKKNSDKDSKTLKNDYDKNEMPIYDGEEPYYLFKRKFDLYEQKRDKLVLHKLILRFLNELFNTEFTSITKMKIITYDMIPSTASFIEKLKSDETYKDVFRIRTEDKTVYKLIDTLLSRIDFSFVEVETSKQMHYTVKHRLSKTDPDNDYYY